MLITLKTFIDPPIAYLAKVRLDFEGISSWIADDYHINLQWTISLALGGVKLRVHETDYEDAKKALESDCSEALENIAFPESIEKDRCDRCGSSDIVLVNWTRKAAALSLLTGLLFMFIYKRLKCSTCGNKMKIKNV